jgi:peptidoglycan hydrolase-like protein with peptidoglycan-binding domain
MEAVMSVVEFIAPDHDRGAPHPGWDDSAERHQEFLFQGELKIGAWGALVRRAQELLVLSDHKLAIDGEFGPATRQAVTEFQLATGLVPTGTINRASHDLLIQPLSGALTPIGAAGLSLSDLVAHYAGQHLVERPREVGGRNRGPWVRLYMGGRESPERPWNAAMVCFLLRQAADTLGVEAPLEHTCSCDMLAEAARRAGLLVPESHLEETERRTMIHPGSLFLTRKTPNHWSHVGVVVENPGDCFVSIEGNYSEQDDPDGHQTCRRVRGFKDKDFIVFD